jgi:hypothetical protein
MKVPVFLEVLFYTSFNIAYKRSGCYYYLNIVDSLKPFIGEGFRAVIESLNYFFKII